MPIYEPICLYCKHYHRKPQSEETCKAFPLGIPVKFTEGGKDHFDVEPDDGGIQFEITDGLKKSEYVKAYIAKRKKIHTSS